MHTSRRFALGGAVGPAAFIGTWATLGATRSGYRPIHDAISRLAERGAATAPAMTAGFVVFGTAVPLAAAAFKQHVRGPAWIPTLLTGLATLGVAATPLDTSPAIDRLHGVFAGTGYVKDFACLRRYVKAAPTASASVEQAHAFLGPRQYDSFETKLLSQFLCAALQIAFVRPSTDDFDNDQLAACSTDAE